jgi:1,4-alpha-glucan branching enzyme
MQAIDGSTELAGGLAREVQTDDRLFPLIQPLDWAPLQPTAQPSTPST